MIDLLLIENMLHGLSEKKYFLKCYVVIQLSALCFQSRHVRSRAPANTIEFVIKLHESNTAIFKYY